jgi:hypothetical protein
MRANPYLRNGLAIGIILLFIGVTLAPSINFNVVKASTDNELVEVTTQACGIKGFGNQTVKLTKQQYQNLEQYLTEFRARLNKTTTREEAVPIFKDAVVELNKYGLLPKGMSVEQAQKLVTGGYQNDKSMEIVHKLFGMKNKPYEFINVLCFVATLCLNAANTNMILLFSSFLGLLLWGLLVLSGINVYIAYAISLIAGIPLFIVSQFKTLLFMSIIDVSPILSGVFFFYSNGLYGIQRPEYFNDIIGFTGIKIGWPLSFYLGFALVVE